MKDYEYLYRIVMYLGVGLAYQVLVYGPDSWTSMELAAHVLGWWVFIGVTCFHWVWRIGLWTLAIFAVITMAICMGMLSEPLRVRLRAWRHNNKLRQVERALKQEQNKEVV